MKKRKIFGIGAAVLMLLVMLAPMVNSLTVGALEIKNDNISKTLDNRQLFANEDIVYMPYRGQKDIEIKPGLVYYESTQVIIRYRLQVTLEIIEAITGCTCIDTITEIKPYAALFELRPGMILEEFLSLIEDITDIVFVELNAIFSNFYNPNDPKFSDQWNLKAIKCPSAWDKTKGDNDVIIAIIDTGFDFNHRDKPYYVASGYDFVDDDSDAQDENGHGTHCVGIAAAAINNEEGIAGVSNCKILVVRVLDANGRGTLWNVAKGIIWAAVNHAWVISMSLGAYLGPVSDDNRLLKDTCEYALYDQQALMVAASGNDGSLLPGHPAVYPSVLAIGAVDEELDIASFSNKGNKFVAPGVNICSLKKGGGYVNWDGTSMACPHVAGVAGLCFSVLKEKKPLIVINVLIKGAIHLGQYSVYGYGLINAESVYKCSSREASFPIAKIDISVLFYNLLERFPNAFPLLRQILRN